MYNNNTNNNNTNNNKNHKVLKTFSIVDFPEDGKLYGQYKAFIPKKAAEKAFNHLFSFSENNIKNSHGKFIVFTIKDINNNKYYKYIGNRVKLEKPVTLTNKNGAKKEYYYKNVIGKYREELDKIV